MWPITRKDLGSVVPERQIDFNCPRALLILGSFEWIAKQKNLELIVDSLLPSLKRNGITLHVVGKVPQTLREGYSHYSPHLIFHGQLDDVSTIVSASRGGLVPDLLGGGFKLKVLDYGFRRLPIFGLRQAVAGTTSEEQSAMLLADDLEELAKTILNHIDDFATLNRSQCSLFKLVSDRFGLVAGTKHLRRVFWKATSLVKENTVPAE